MFQASELPGCNFEGLSCQQAARQTHKSFFFIAFGVDRWKSGVSKGEFVDGQRVSTSFRPMPSIITCLLEPHPCRPACEEVCCEFPPCDMKGIIKDQGVCKPGQVHDGRWHGETLMVRSSCQNKRAAAESVLLCVVAA